MRTSYHIGDTVRLSCTFTNSAGTATDPTTIALTIQDPSANDTTLTYALAQVTREKAGNFYYDLLIDEALTWTWRWVGTGAVAQSTQGTFYVEALNV